MKKIIHSSEGHLYKRCSLCLKTEKTLKEKTEEADRNNKHIIGYTEKTLKRARHKYFISVICPQLQVMQGVYISALNSMQLYHSVVIEYDN